VNQLVTVKLSCS